MYIPLHFQTSEYDCVPTALINAVSYLFERREVPPMVIRHIYLYCLDTVGRNARFGIGGTSKYAVRLVGNWLNNYKVKSFSVKTKFLEKTAVDFSKRGRISRCLKDGGVALCNILLTKKEEHYVMMMDMDETWVYCFDSYKRVRVANMNDNVKVLHSGDGRSPNIKIRIEWLLQENQKRFCLGPAMLRECLLVWRSG